MLREGVAPDRILVTGNTGIDALLETRDGLVSGSLRAVGSPAIDGGKKLILVTAHRRESFGEGLDGICEALLRLAARGDVQIVYPVHPNPEVRTVVERRLGGIAAIRLFFIV